MQLQNDTILKKTTNDPFYNYQKMKKQADAGNQNDSINQFSPSLPQQESSSQKQRGPRYV